MAGNVKVRINVQKLKKTLDNNLSQKKVREAAYNKAVELVDEVVKDTIDEFDAHPVTTELEMGPAAPNLSSTVSEGNLFSFIGFNATENPIPELRRYLKNTGKVYKNSKLVKGEKTNYVFRVDPPDMVAIENMTPLPFEKGRSWVKGVESTISNIGNYIFRKTNTGESGMGIQAKGNKKPVRPAARFRPTVYMTEIVKFFKERLRAIR